MTTQPPGAVVAGTGFSLTVHANDHLGNLDPTFNGDVTIALANNPGVGTVSGTLIVQAVNGVATFPDLRLDTAGIGYTLIASAPASQAPQRLVSPSRLPPRPSW